VLANRSGDGLIALISDKINQWTLLVGMLPLALSVGAGVSRNSLSPIARPVLTMASANGSAEMRMTPQATLTRAPIAAHCLAGDRDPVQAQHLRRRFCRAGRHLRRLCLARAQPAEKCLGERLGRDENDAAGDADESSDRGPLLGRRQGVERGCRTSTPS
jgi:hypothetical protein